MNSIKIKVGSKIVISESLDALSLEYKRDYGTARGDLDISNVVDNLNAFGVIRVFGSGFSEKITDLPGVNMVHSPMMLPILN